MNDTYRYIYCITCIIAYVIIQKYLKSTEASRCIIDPHRALIHNFQGANLQVAQLESRQCCSSSIALNWIHALRKSSFYFSLPHHQLWLSLSCIPKRISYKLRCLTGVAAHSTIPFSVLIRWMGLRKISSSQNFLAMRLDRYASSFDLQHCITRISALIRTEKNKCVA